MDRSALLDLLSRVQAGELQAHDAVDRIATAATSQLGDYARVDAERPLRTGMPEVIYGESKTGEHCARIAAEIDRLGQPVLVTRLSPEKAREVEQAVPDGRYHAVCRMFSRPRGLDKHPLRGPVAVLAAGTSDIPWAEEAAVTLETIGQPVERLYDVGVAGLHRLLERMDVLRRAGALVVVAGMEGALPSVVAGLVGVPVFAVPAPVGYGASFGGLSALLGMLNSCSPNVACVNIGNGFGAAYMAALSNRVGPPRD